MCICVGFVLIMTSTERRGANQKKSYKQQHFRNRNILLHNFRQLLSYLLTKISYTLQCLMLPITRMTRNSREVKGQRVIHIHTSGVSTLQLLCWTLHRLLVWIKSRQTHTCQCRIDVYMFEGSISGHVFAKYLQVFTQNLTKKRCHWTVSHKLSRAIDGYLKST